MGLGKTIMMIALILLHQRPAGLPAVDKNEVLNSNATLIALPAPIIFQWVKEIKKFAPHLKVYIYELVDISRKELAAYDIVLISFHDLIGETNFISHHQCDRSSRYAKKTKFRNPQLCNINWWRVVLDEAQMSQTCSSSFKLISKLPRVNPWLLIV